MSKLRRKFIAVLVALLCSTLLCGAIAFLPKSKTANAARENSLFYVIGGGTDLYKGGDIEEISLNSKVMDELFKVLTGSAGATFNEVKNLVNGGSVVTSDDIRNRNNSKNVSIVFGGKKWDLVYLTMDKNNENVVLDLWQSSDTITKTSNYAKHSDKTSTAVNYPSSMYTTSVIRVSTLNAGGYYSASTSTLSTSRVDQSSANDYARFTMPKSSVSNSVRDFIVQPKDVAYQETENGVADPSNKLFINCNYSLPNCAYGTPTNANWYTGMDYAARDSYRLNAETQYGYWKNDYLWLPSLTETGNNDVTGNGLWKTDTNLRSTLAGSAWLRSGNYLHDALSLSATGTSYFANATTTNTLLVRPAIHLNLTKAAAAAKGVYFGTDKTTTTSVDGVKTAKIEHVYDNTDAEIEVTDYGKLDVSGQDYLTNYSSGNGKFSAIEPELDKDKSYKITVKPQAGYYWDDATTTTNGQEERQYQIVIKATGINVDWNNALNNVATGQSLLQASNKITSATLGSNPTFKEQFYITHASGATAPPDVDPPLDTDWKDRPAAGVSNDYFKATETGTYRVRYRIKADYHTTKTSSYTVRVSADKVTIEIKDGENPLIGSAQYSMGDAAKLNNQSWLKEKIIDKVKMTGSTSGVYDEGAMESLLANLEVVLFVYNNSGERENVTLGEGKSYYNVNTYYLDVQYPEGTAGALAFEWKTDGNDKEIHPSFTVTKRQVAVRLVAEDENGTLTHVYGDNPVKIKCEFVNASADGKLDNGETIAEVGLRDTFKIKDSGDELNNLTPANSYYIVGTVSNSSNYEVLFDDSEYVITKRPITLQIVDETVEYGTDYGSYKFKTMTVADGNTVGIDTISNLTADAKYYLLLNNAEAALRSDLAIGEYVLYAEVTSGNYTITVLSGKLTVTKANFDMSGVSFTNAGHIYDGNPHPAKIDGSLPSNDISVSYRYVNMADGSESTEAPTEIGLYLVYASFTHSNTNYNEILDKVAYLRIAETQEELNQAYPDLPTEEDIANAADLAKKKQEAKKDLEEEAKKKKDEIDANPDLTDEEKQAAKDRVDEELKKGNGAIDSAKNVSDMNQAFNDGKANIEKIKAEHMEERSFPWWILAVIGGALLLLMLLIIIIVKRRNSEDEEEDYYDDEYDFDDEEVDEEYEDSGEDF